MELILKERLRQIEEEEFNPRHDLNYKNKELVKAGDAYLNNDVALWPWDEEDFKPTTAQRNLEKAGALYLAELYVEKKRFGEQRPDDIQSINQLIQLCAQKLDNIINESSD